MKTIKTVLVSVVLVTLVSISGYAVSDAKVIAVVNEAEWCPTCQKNGKRAMEAFKANNDGSILFVMNNVTNDETKSKSDKELKKYGLDKIMQAYKGTGAAYFFNAKTKEFISKVSVSKTDEELATALKIIKPGMK